MTFTKGFSPGTIARITEMHAQYYSAEWGLDIRFEAQVAEGLAEFATRYMPGRDLLLRAERHGKTVGTITIDGKYPSAENGEAYLRWFNVDALARGMGLGKTLMEEAMSFVDTACYQSVTLKTFKGLEAASSLYLNHGFELIEETPNDPIYGVPVTAQTYRWTRPRHASVG